MIQGGGGLGLPHFHDSHTLMTSANGYPTRGTRPHPPAPARRPRAPCRGRRPSLRPFFTNPTKWWHVTRGWEREHAWGCVQGVSWPPEAGVSTILAGEPGATKRFLQSHMLMTPQRYMWGAFPPLTPVDQQSYDKSRWICYFYQLYLD